MDKTESECYVRARERTLLSSSFFSFCNHCVLQNGKKDSVIFLAMKDYTASTREKQRRKNNAP